jgi:hypothetical protein
MKYLGLQNTEYRIRNTECRIQKLLYIKLPMYLFFYMALGVNDLDAGKLITRAIGRSGPLTLDFPASKSIRPTPQKQQVH